MLKGLYNFSEKADATANLYLAARQEQALDQGSKIHPQYQDAFESAFSLAWQKIPHNLGAWAEYTEATRQRFYPDLIKPDGNVSLLNQTICLHT